MLPPRRRKFATEYVKNGFNGVQAVYAAGYKQGYNSACVEASRLLRNAKVIEYVEESLKNSKMGADEVLERLAEIARKDAKFSGSDVVKANELLGKGHKLFTEKVEHSNDIKPSSVQQLVALLNEARIQIDPERAAEIMAASYARAGITENPSGSVS